MIGKPMRSRDGGPRVAKRSALRTAAHLAAGVTVLMLLPSGDCWAEGSSFPQRERIKAMRVFVADSLTKVLRELEEGESPLRQGPARISACRNERESLQVVVGAGEQPLSQVRVEVSDLRHEAGGAVIPSARTLANPVGYVKTNRPRYPVDRVGWWPDPLMPSGPVAVEAGGRQPFWITVHVPDSAAPGRYMGAISVSAEGLADREVGLELTVWDFTLAATPPLASAIPIYQSTLSHFYNRWPIPQSMLRNYWDMLFTHRLSSDIIRERNMRAVLDGPETDPSDYYRAIDEGLEYCFPRGMTAFRLALLPGGPDLTEEQQERLIAYLSDFAKHLDARGWLDHAFVYVRDEPPDDKAPEVLKELKTVHRANPRLRAGLCGPVTGPLVELCENEVDICVLHMLNIARGGAPAQANMDRWRRENKVLWMYVACDVRHPYPNIFIDYPLMDCRILPWLCWECDVEGFAYWTAIHWGEENLKGDRPEEKWPNRPWVAANFVSRWGHQYNGDGHLIYPGPNGTALSSIRLEALRDGMEDYEYVWLIEKGVERLEKMGRRPELVTEARQWLEGQSVVRSFTEWCHEPEALLAAREELADLIVRVGRATHR